MGVTGAWADSAVGKDTSTSGTIIYYNANSDSKSNYSLTIGTDDNGMYAVEGTTSFKRSYGEISVASNAIVMVCVDNITSGTVSITLASTGTPAGPDWASTDNGSDGRYFQLYIDNTAAKKYLYSKYSINTTADEETGITKENDKIRGLRSFDYTSSDLTTVEGKKYLKFKALGGEMKPYGFKLVSSAPSSYTVTYNNNGGSGTIENSTGTSITLSNGTGFTAPTGYSFAGWNTENDGSGTSYTAGQEGITSSLDLYATWTQGAAINANTGSANTTYTATLNSTSIAIASAPTKDEATLTGYWTAASAGTKIANADGSLVASTNYADENGKWNNYGDASELFAQWQETVYYTVTLNPNGGTIDDATGWTLDNGQYKKTSIAEGTELELPTFTKTDRTFLTWRDDSDNEYTSPVTVNSNLTITAIWGKEKETIIYSWQSPSGTAVETGGTATHYNNNTANNTNERVNYQNVANGTTYYTICLNGKNDYSTDHIRIALDENVKTGDEVRVTAYYNKDSNASAAAKMNTQDGTVIFTGSNLPNIYSSGSPVLQTYTVPAGINTNAIKMTRHQTGSTTFITKLQIVRTETIEEQDPCEAPTITSQPTGADYEWNDAISPLTVTASVTDGGTLSYQWYKKGSPDVEVGTNSASYTPAEAGTYYVVVTNSKDGYEDASTTSSDAVITITDSRKSVTLSFSESEINDYNFDDETLTAPTLTAVDGESNPIDLSELPELTFSKIGDVVEVNATTGALTAANINNFGSSTVTVSFAGNDTYKPAEDKTYTVERAPYLRQVLFDNGFDAFIKEGSKTVKVYYMAGTDAPAQTGDIQVADGFTAEVVGNNLVLTQTATSKVKTYAITKTAVTPFVGTGKQTFDGTETYVASGYGWDASESKKWKFSKTDTDWTREAPGNTRLYFFVGAGTSASFSFATSRAVNIKVNGVSAGTNVSSITLNADQPNMIEFQSNQTNGDGGFKDMTITGPKQAVKIGSHGYSTFISDKILDFEGIDGLTAYRAKRDDKAVTLTAVTEVDANKGIVLEGTASQTYYVPVLASTDANVDTDLTGNATTAYELVSGKYYYVLSYQNGAEGFYNYNGSAAIPAGKAFFESDTELTAGGGANYLSIIYAEDETDGIASIENGKLNIETPAFNLSGQKVGAEYKGIVIVNGKKYVRK